MPIYIYECNKCGHVVEELQRSDDPAPAKCEKCGAKHVMERVLGPPNFILAPGGVGWGKDGYSG